MPQAKQQQQHFLNPHPILTYSTHTVSNPHHLFRSTLTVSLILTQCRHHREPSCSTPSEEPNTVSTFSPSTSTTTPPRITVSLTASQLTSTPNSLTPKTTSFSSPKEPGRPAFTLPYPKLNLNLYPFSPTLSSTIAQQLKTTNSTSLPRMNNPAPFSRAGTPFILPPLMTVQPSRDSRRVVRWITAPPCRSPEISSPLLLTALVGGKPTISANSKRRS